MIKTFVKYIDTLLLALLLGLCPDLASGGWTIADEYLDEDLSYSIGFWFFEDVAVGRMTLAEVADGQYVATLTAHTTGTVDRILRHRKDRYVATLALAENGARFVTRSFEKTIETAGKTRRTFTEFDYDERVMRWKGWTDGKEDRSGEVKFPDGIYCDDPLGAFYNFRYGVYGPPEMGKEYRIQSFPKEDRVPEIRIVMATSDEMRKRAGGNPVAGFLADVELDKELFGSKSGQIVIYFSADMLPTAAIARDVLFFGDVKGRLSRIGGVRTKAGVTE